ncbi:MAG: hypothetical protein NT018_08450 [Armatimonadetes bacterium]|nr:hypothetical protein [Armatimonadota bacterium]
MKRVSLLLFIAAVCLSAVSAAFAQLPTGTVAYWAFNNALTDGSANGNTLKGTSGTVAYSATTVKFGSASLYVDGSATLGTLSGSFPTGVPTGANPYTVAAWIKADTGCSLVGGWIGYGNNSNSQGNNFRLIVANNSVWEYWYYNDFGATLASGTFFDGWHCVVGRYTIPAAPYLARLSQSPPRLASAVLSARVEPWLWARDPTRRSPSLRTQAMLSRR